MVFFPLYKYRLNKTILKLFVIQALILKNGKLYGLSILIIIIVRFLFFRFCF